MNTSLTSIKYLEEEVDVLVVGGGTAGVIAAIQAARIGVKTAIVEVGMQLGGTMTTGMVTAPAYFYAPDRQIIAGIGWELVTKAVDFAGLSLPDFAHPSSRRPSFHVRTDGYSYTLLAEEACLQAGVTLHYQELISDIEEHDGAWMVKTIGKCLRRTIIAKEIVDCTGDADIVGMLGFERLRSDVRQPGTLRFQLEGCDVESLDQELVEEHYQQALADGKLHQGDFSHRDRPFLDFLKASGANLQHVIGADGSDSELQTLANIEGRAALLRMLRFLKTVPGCENVHIKEMSTYTTIRETYQIVGETSMTYEDYMSGRVFDDALAYTYYFIDVHTDDGGEIEFLEKGVYPTIPFGALIPKGSQRLLVAGRSLASDRKAHSAIRIEASCMAMGQVAGAAAALGVRLGCASRDIPLEQLRELLRKHGAIVPKTDDVTDQ